MSTTNASDRLVALLEEKVTAQAKEIEELKKEHCKLLEKNKKLKEVNGAPPGAKKNKAEKEGEGNGKKKKKTDAASA